jgi:uncharacterized protein YegP (UPF0339 family)
LSGSAAALEHGAPGAKRDLSVRLAVAPGAVRGAPDEDSGEERALPAKLVVYPDRTKKWRWKLLAANGQSVASSGESFATKASAKRAAESMQKTAAKADVVVEEPAKK